MHVMFHITRHVLLGKTASSGFDETGNLRKLGSFFVWFSKTILNPNLEMTKDAYVSVSDFDKNI